MFHLGILLRNDKVVVLEYEGSRQAWTTPHEHPIDPREIKYIEMYWTMQNMQLIGVAEVAIRRIVTCTRSFHLLGRGNGHTAHVRLTLGVRPTQRPPVECRVENIECYMTSSPWDRFGREEPREHPMWHARVKQGVRNSVGERRESHVDYDDIIRTMTGPIELSARNGQELDRDLDLDTEMEMEMVMNRYALSDTEDAQQQDAAAAEGAEGAAAAEGAEDAEDAAAAEGAEDAEGAAAAEGAEDAAAAEGAEGAEDAAAAEGAEDAEDAAAAARLVAAAQRLVRLTQAAEGAQGAEAADILAEYEASAHASARARASAHASARASARARATASEPRRRGERNAATVLDQIREELQCAICHDLLRKPVLLKCGHIFCEECLRRTDAATGMQPTKYTRCALCRGVAKKMKTQLKALNNIIGIVRDSSGEEGRND